MTTKIHLTYFGMDGEGATVKEAKADAGKKIERAMAGMWMPKLLRLNNSMGQEVTVLLYRTPWDWHYTFIDERTGWLTYSVAGFSDEEECERSATRHAAKNLIRPQGDDEHIAKQIKDQRDRQDFLEYAAWQHGYRQAHSEGLSDNECRIRASQAEEKMRSR